MDAATLYMVLTLSNGEHRTLMQFPLATNRECQGAAQIMDQGRIATAYRRAGTVDVYCAPKARPLIIAR